MEISELTALNLSAAIRRRELSVREVTQWALERAYADRLGAYAFVTEEYALNRADELDRTLTSGSAEIGPFFGVPCPIKDLGQVAGLPFEAGAALLRGHVADADDGIVTRFHEAGTVCVGKTATPEFGLPCYTEPDGRPPAATPWDPSRSAGGSSGGAAAAVAGGYVPIAHGSDGGGSIRIPAASCGLVGFKASRGRVSRGPRQAEGPGLASDGVLTRDVRDSAAALDILAPGWPGDPYPVPLPTETYLNSCNRATPRLRIGVLTEPVIAEAPVHAEALAAVVRATRLLEDLGHTVEKAPRPFEVEAWDAFRALWAVGALAAPVPPEGEQLLRPLTRWLRNEGRGFSGLEYAQATLAAQQVARATAYAWDPFDIILTPTLAQPPLPHGTLRDDADPAGDFAAQTRFTPWTSVYNISGRPAITLPLHTAEVDGVELPFGVMLGGQMHADAMLFSLATDLEEAAGGWRRPPQG